MATTKFITMSSPPVAGEIDIMGLNGQSWTAAGLTWIAWWQITRIIMTDRNWPDTPPGEDDPSRSFVSAVYGHSWMKCYDFSMIMRHIARLDV